MDRPRRETWYGWKSLASDAISITAILTTFEHETRPLTILGAVGYGLAPAVIHVTHGNSRLAGLSVGYRVVGASATLFGFADSVRDEGSTGLGPGIFALGALMVLSAPLLDSLLGWETHDDDRTFAIAPTLAPDRIRVDFAGRF